MPANKQPKLEVTDHIETTTNYDSELHSELIIDEKFSVENEADNMVQTHDKAPSAPALSACSTSVATSQPVVTAQEFVARAISEGRLQIPLTPGQEFVAQALREGSLQMKVIQTPLTPVQEFVAKSMNKGLVQPRDNYTSKTNNDADQTTNTAPAPPPSEVTVTTPPMLRLRPIEQLLAAVEVVEGNSASSTTSLPIQTTVDKDIQHSVLTQVDHALDRLTCLVDKRFEHTCLLPDNTVYKEQIDTEMRRRTVILAEQALKFDELKTIQFLRNFEHLPSDINLSYRINQEILIKHKNPITSTERTQYNQYKGFQFQKELEGRLVHIEEKKLFKDTPVPEYSSQTPTMYFTDTPCVHCKVGHKAGTALCHGAQQLKNMTKEQLKNDHTWRDKTKAVVISNRALTKLPIVLKDDVINIQVPRTLTYWAGRGHTGQDDKTSSLYTEIMEILQLLGIESTYLVFIEFLKPHSSKIVPEYQHLAFARICRELQTNYGGLIIPVLGLYKPRKGETSGHYLASKYRLASCYSGAFAVGRWLGIPVDIPNIQNSVESRESHRKFSPSWQNEPLFNSDAEPTREWYRRLAIYFMSRISWFKPYYPMADTHSRRIVLASPPYAAKPTILQ